jgi:hypothetical protein
MSADEIPLLARGSAIARIIINAGIKTKTLKRIAPKKAAVIATIRIAIEHPAVWHATKSCDGLLNEAPTSFLKSLICGLETLIILEASFGLSESSCWDTQNFFGWEIPFAIDYAAGGKNPTNGAELRQRMGVGWPPFDDGSRYFHGSSALFNYWSSTAVCYVLEQAGSHAATDCHGSDLQS